MKLKFLLIGLISSQLALPARSAQAGADVSDRDEDAPQGTGHAHHSGKTPAGKMVAIPGGGETFLALAQPDYVATHEPPTCTAF